MNEEEVIQEIILNYFLEYPDCGGTLEDISTWWMEFERINRSVDNVAQILEKLIENGIIEREVKGGTAIYKICKAFK